jgi:RNA polymerase sigma-70 factor (ECF subfamily)
LSSSALEPERLPRHLDRLTRAALSLTGSREDAEDLVQETYLRVMRRPRELHADNEVGYLLRTMRNTWLNVLRRQGAERVALEASAALLERRAEHDPLARLEARALLAAMTDMSPAHREVLAAVDVLGLSYRQAASALRTCEGTVMSRLFRARVELSRRLGS